MVTHTLSKKDARRIAVRAQWLHADRPTGLLPLVHRLTLLHLDPIAAVAPSAGLVSWSRLGNRFDSRELERAVSEGSLLELDNHLRPAADLALYRAEMSVLRSGIGLTGWQLGQHRWVHTNDACRRNILRLLAEAGPMTARELPDTCVEPWRSTGWTNKRNVGQLLILMARRGEVAPAGREGKEKLWDLAERVYPDDPIVPAEQAIKERNCRRLAALGIARAKGPATPVEPVDVNDAGEEAIVEDVKGVWRVDPTLVGQPFEGRAALLSPWDLLCQDRKRMAELFEYDYILEMYKPAARRRWGYYALPVLYGDRLVGKLDAIANRKVGTFTVHAVHWDVPPYKAMSDAVDREIFELATWLNLELVYES